MKKRVLLVIGLMLSLFLITGCGKKEIKADTKAIESKARMMMALLESADINGLKDFQESSDFLKQSQVAQLTSMDANGNFIGWDRKALWLYLELKEANDIKAFYDALGNNILFKEILLPANFSENTVQELGDDAARKTAGMAFYKGKKRVRYKRFKQNQFMSMKEAIDMCKKSKF